MEVKEADDLRKAWGDKPCAHPWWLDVTLNGADTGKVACKTCGHERRKGQPEPAPTPTVVVPEAQAPPVSQPVKELDAKDISVVPAAAAPEAQAPPVNEKVKGLESAVDGVVAMLGADFAFTMQDEAKIASVADKLRDAVTRRRDKQKKKKRS